MRKPMAKVERIDLGRVKQVSQDDLEQLVDLQRIVWRAQTRATRFAERLSRRVHIGATVEDGPLYFDAELGMARSRKEQAG